MKKINDLDGYCVITYPLIKGNRFLEVYYYLFKMWKCCKNSDGYIEFSIRQLMEVLGCTNKHSILDAISKLEDTNIIEVIRGVGGKRNKFRFTNEFLTTLKKPQGGASNDTKGGASNDTKGGASNDTKGGASNDTKGGASNDTNNKVYNREINTSKYNTNKKENDFFIFDDKFRRYITNELNTMKDVATTNGQSFTDIATSRNIINSIFGEYRRKKECVPESLLPRFTEIYNEELNKIRTI